MKVIGVAVPPVSPDEDLACHLVKGNVMINGAPSPDLRDAAIDHKPRVAGRVTARKPCIAAGAPDAAGRNQFDELFSPADRADDVVERLHAGLDFLLLEHDVLLLRVPLWPSVMVTSVMVTAGG